MSRYFSGAIAAIALWASVASAASPSQPADPRISQAVLGNVFVDGQPVSVNIDTHAGSVQYRLTDAWGVEVLHGETNTSGKTLALTLPLKQHGFFELAVTSKDGPVGQAHTHLAILAPYDRAAHPNTPFGVMTHFSQGWDTDLLALIATAGVTDIRDEPQWATVEQKKDVFDFTRPDHFFVPMQKAGISALMPLTFGNRLYDHLPTPKDEPGYGIAPYTEDGFSGYARYGAAVATHYSPRAVEIWNEYNGAFARGPADGKPEVYAEMAKHAYPAIKKAHPATLVFGCSTISIPLGWIEDVFRAGGLDAMDGVSIHPYGYSAPPEGHEAGLQALQALIRKYNHGQAKPVWVTEQGWYVMPPETQGNHDPITEMTKARYFVRAWTLFAANGVEKSFWYLCRDYAEFGEMGLLGKDTDPAGRYAPHQAYVAMAVMIRELAGASYVSRDASAPEVRSYLFRYTVDKTPVRVVWATRPANVAFASDKPLVVTDMMGEDRTIHPIAGKVHLGLGESPVYVHGDIGVLAEETTFAVTVPAEAQLDDALPVEASMHADTGVAVEWTLAAGASKLSGSSLKDGTKLELVLPAPHMPALGERWTPYEIRQGDKIVFAGAALTQLRSPLVLAEFPHHTDAGNIVAKLRNPSLSAAVTLQSATLRIGQTDIAEIPSRTIAAGATFEISLHVAAATPWTIQPAILNLVLRDAPPVKWTGEISYNPIARRTIKVDGDLSDWQNIPAADLSKCPYFKIGAPRTGDDDLSGTLQLCRDDDNLYFAAHIVDDVFSQEHTGTNVWKGDNIQIGLAAASPWIGGDGSGWAHQELGLSLTPLGPQFYRFGGLGESGLRKNIPLVVKRDGAVTLYECAIPWKEVGMAAPAPGKLLSFGAYINDSDGHGRKGFLQWADIKALHRHQACVLVEAAK